ncbi:MAG: iron ABC transporter permease [Eubacteriales bacterium]|nr:iron ABC transporter permease [Eubacteriales bacterium]
MDFKRGRQKNSTADTWYYRALDRGIFYLMAALVLVFVLWPLLCIAGKSIQADGGISFRHYHSLFTDNFKLLKNSFFVAIPAALLSTLIGVAVAFRVALSKGRIRSVLMAILLMTMVSPPFISSLVYIQLFGRRGWITHGLLGLMISPYNQWGIIAMQSLHFASLNAIFMIGLLNNLDHNMIYASRDLGASPTETLKGVVFPLMLPGAGVCFILSLIRSISDFGTPIVIGGRFNTLAAAIYMKLIGYAQLEEASAMNMLLLIPAVIVFVLFRWLMKKSDGMISTGNAAKTSGSLPMKIRGPISWGINLISFVFYGMMVMQYLCIFLTGFLKSKRGVYYFTLENFNSLFAYNIDSLVRSVQYSLLVAVFGTLFAMLFAYYLERRKVRFKGFYDFVSTMPYLLPGTCFGIGYILAFNKGPLRLTGTAAIIVLNMIFKQLPTITKLCGTSLAQMNARMEDAARDLGAGNFFVTKDIVLPNLTQTFVTGFIYNFTSAMTTAGAIMFLISSRHKVAVYTLFDAINSGEYAVASLISTMIIVITLLVTGAVSAVMLRKPGNRSRTAK